MLEQHVVFQRIRSSDTCKCLVPYLGHIVCLGNDHFLFLYGIRLDKEALDSNKQRPVGFLKRPQQGGCFSSSPDPENTMWVLSSSSRKILIEEHGSACMCSDSCLSVRELTHGGLCLSGDNLAALWAQSSSPHLRICHYFWATCLESWRIQPWHPSSAEAILPFKGLNSAIVLKYWVYTKFDSLSCKIHTYREGWYPHCKWRISCPVVSDSLRPHGL